MAEPEDESPPVLLPCAICTRTFKPDSLEKHAKVCEKNSTKTRKVFDSSRQRIQGTDLAEFLPIILHNKKNDKAPEKKPVSKWKEKHLEFVRAIRAARGAGEEENKTSAIPSRPSNHEKCPHCDRNFGPKAFDRHIEWCKEQKARIPKSPASQQAKERLEARTKYRAPPLAKSKRTLTREKYARISQNPTQDLSPMGSRSAISLSQPSASPSRESKSTTSTKSQSVRSTAKGSASSSCIERRGNSQIRKRETSASPCKRPINSGNKNNTIKAMSVNVKSSDISERENLLSSSCNVTKLQPGGEGQLIKGVKPAAPQNRPSVPQPVPKLNKTKVGEGGRSPSPVKCGLKSPGAVISCIQKCSQQDKRYGQGTSGTSSRESVDTLVSAEQTKQEMELVENSKLALESGMTVLKKAIPKVTTKRKKPKLNKITINHESDGIIVSPCPVFQPYSQCGSRKDISEDFVESGGKKCGKFGNNGNLNKTFTLSEEKSLDVEEIKNIEESSLLNRNPMESAEEEGYIEHSDMNYQQEMEKSGYKPLKVTMMEKQKNTPFNSVRHCSKSSNVARVERESEGFQEEECNLFASNFDSPVENISREEEQERSEYLRSGDGKVNRVNQPENSVLQILPSKSFAVVYTRNKEKTQTSYSSCKDSGEKQVIPFYKATQSARTKACSHYAKHQDIPHASSDPNVSSLGFVGKVEQVQIMDTSDGHKGGSAETFVVSDDSKESLPVLLKDYNEVYTNDVLTSSSCESRDTFTVALQEHAQYERENQVATECQHEDAYCILSASDNHTSFCTFNTKDVIKSSAVENNNDVLPLSGMIDVLMSTGGSENKINTDSFNIQHGPCYPKNQNAQSGDNWDTPVNGNVKNASVWSLNGRAFITSESTHNFSTGVKHSSITSKMVKNFKEECHKQNCNTFQHLQVSGDEVIMRNKSKYSSSGNVNAGKLLKRSDDNSDQIWSIASQEFIKRMKEKSRENSADSLGKKQACCEEIYQDAICKKISDCSKTQEGTNKYHIINCDIENDIVKLPQVERVVKCEKPLDNRHLSSLFLDHPVVFRCSNLPCVEKKKQIQGRRSRIYSLKKHYKKRYNMALKNDCHCDLEQPQVKKRLLHDVTQKHVGLIICPSCPLILVGESPLVWDFSAMMQNEGYLPHYEKVSDCKSNSQEESVTKSHFAKCNTKKNGEASNAYSVDILYFNEAYIHTDEEAALDSHSHHFSESPEPDGLIYCSKCFSNENLRLCSSDNTAQKIKGLARLESGFKLDIRAPSTDLANNLENGSKFSNADFCKAEEKKNYLDTNRNLQSQVRHIYDEKHMSDEQREIKLDVLSHDDVCNALRNIKDDQNSEHNQNDTWRGSASNDAKTDLGNNTDYCSVDAVECNGKVSEELDFHNKIRNEKMNNSMDQREGALAANNEEFQPLHRTYDVCGNESLKETCTVECISTKHKEICSLHLRSNKEKELVECSDQSHNVNSNVQILSLLYNTSNIENEENEELVMRSVPHLNSSQDQCMKEKCAKRDKESSDLISTNESFSSTGMPEASCDFHSQNVNKNLPAFLEEQESNNEDVNVKVWVCNSNRVLHKKYPADADSVRISFDIGFTSDCEQISNNAKFNEKLHEKIEILKHNTDNLLDIENKKCVTHGVINTSLQTFSVVHKKNVSHNETSYLNEECGTEDLQNEYEIEEMHCDTDNIMHPDYYYPAEVKHETDKLTLPEIPKLQKRRATPVKKNDILSQLAEKWMTKENMVQCVQKAKKVSHRSPGEDIQNQRRPTKRHKLPPLMQPLKNPLAKNRTKFPRVPRRKSAYRTSNITLVLKTSVDAKEVYDPYVSAERQMQELLSHGDGAHVVVAKHAPAITQSQTILPAFESSPRSAFVRYSPKGSLNSTVETTVPSSIITEFENLFISGSSKQYLPRSSNVVGEDDNRNMQGTISFELPSPNNNAENAQQPRKPSKIRAKMESASLSLQQSVSLMNYENSQITTRQSTDSNIFIESEKPTIAQSLFQDFSAHTVPSSESSSFLPPTSRSRESFSMMNKIKDNGNLMRRSATSMADTHQQARSNSLSGKFSSDSAYGSLNRRTPTPTGAQAQAHERTELGVTESERSCLMSSSSSESSLPPLCTVQVVKHEASSCSLTPTPPPLADPSHPQQTVPRMSKFCHECGSKYPVTVAKFCCECGVRRLAM